MYNKYQISKGLKNPHLIFDEIYDYISMPGNKLRTKFFRFRHGNGIDVMDKDWDNLILLDACRFDYFKQVNDIEGELKSVVSKGGHSWAFIKGNFVGEEFHDTIYITANPHVERLPDGIFYYIENLGDKWDNELQTILPEDVTDAALKRNQQYPQKS